MALTDFTSPQRASRPWPRLLAAAAAVALLLVLIPLYATAWRVPAVGLFHEDGLNLVTARAMAEGRGYRIISRPGEPEQTQTPPLFPAVLAAAWRLQPAFPDNVALLKLVPLSAALLWFWLTVRLVGGLGLPGPLPWLIVVASAATPWVLVLSTALLAETLFAALVTGALLCLDTGEDLPSSQRVIAAALLAAAATLTRATGMALVVSGTAWLLVGRRDLARAVLFSAVALLLLAPWFTWVGEASASGYSSANATAAWSTWNVLSPGTGLALATRLRVIAINGLAVAAAPGRAFGLPVGSVTIALASALLVAGLIRPAVQARATTWFVVAYLGMIVAWAWPPERFVYVVLPLAVWVMAAGVPRARYTEVIVAAVLVALSVGGLRGTIDVVRRGAATGALVAGGDDARWLDLIDAAGWIRTNTRPGERLVSTLDPLFYLLTGRQATRGVEVDPVRLFYEPAAEDPAAMADRAWEAIGRTRAAIVIDAPDRLFPEAPPLHARFVELERRGLLQPAGQVGPFRFLRAR